MAKMEIYIRVINKSGYSKSGYSAWLSFDPKKVGPTELIPGKMLFDPNTDEAHGTPCTTAAEAMKRAKEAKQMANFSGVPEPKVQFWRIKRGKLIFTKFTKDGKLI